MVEVSSSCIQSVWKELHARTAWNLTHACADLHVGTLCCCPVLAMVEQLEARHLAKMGSAMVCCAPQAVALLALVSSGAVARKLVEPPMPEVPASETKHLFIIHEAGSYGQLLCGPWMA